MNHRVFYGCGHGDFDQLGLGSYLTECKIPTQNKQFSHPIKSIHASAFASALITQDTQQLYMFGCDDDGILGQGPETEEKDQDQGFPKLIKTFPTKLGPLQIKSIALGNSHALALDQFGFVYCWGTFRNPLAEKNGMSFFIPGDEHRQLTPWRMPSLSRVNQIASGSESCFAVIDQDKKCFQWGVILNSRSHKSESDTFIFTSAPQVLYQSVNDNKTKKRKLEQGGEKDKIQLWAFEGSVFIRDKTKYLGMGCNNYHQVDCFSSETFIRFPRVLEFFPDQVMQIAGGERFTWVLTQQGQLFSYGYSFDGSLGRGHPPKDEHERSEFEQFKPVQFLDQSSIFITQIACGSRHGLALDKDGKHVYSWGAGDECALGHGDEQNDCFFPKPIASLSTSTTTITQIAAGASHSLFL